MLCIRIFFGRYIDSYYIKQEERGRGYSVSFIQMVLANNSFRYAFDWVEKKNVTSCKASEKCGFKEIGQLNVTPHLRRLVIVDEGDDILIDLTEMQYNL